MKGWLLLVAAFLLWPGCSSQDACEEPEDVDFGEIVSTERAKYLENDQVQYKCNLGYVLEGPEWIQCKGQKWTPRPPKCLAPCSITRQQLATKNLFVFGSQRKARLVQSNQSLQFLCDEGYVLAVPSVRKCVDGYIELPLCISGGGKNCSGPPRIENGDIITLSAKQYRSGSSVEFRCQSYYAMEGQKRSFCDNGAWTKAPICLDPCVIPRTELESQKITEVENGTEVKNGTDVPENIFVQRGLSIELTCRTGYVLAENSSQSAFEMHCDGTPPVIPKCKEITCNSPRISDGSFRPQRTVYHDGDLIRIRCDSGFTFEPVNGEQVVECTKNGWSPSPKCLKIKCGADYIENGNVLFPKLTYKEGERIRFSCNEGYTYVDRQEASCTENGWSTLLQCKEIQCFPPVVANGRFEPRRTQHMYNDKIETICDEGFVPRGPKLSKCIASGWDPSPACIRKGCDFVRVENGRMQNYNQKYPKREGEQVWFQCDYGFLPKIKHQTWQTVTCTNSRFEPEPKCFKTCDPSQRFYHGHFVYGYRNIYIEGDNITFVCDTGYSPANQQSTITCTKTGWSPAPNCIVPAVGHTCNKLPLANGYFESEQRIFQINAKAIYSCHNGYTTSKGETEAETQCLSGGWSPEPECIKSCLKPPEGDFIFNTTKPVFFPGDKLHYECKEGFEITTNTTDETVACTEKGWEPTPSCNPITCDAPFLENGKIDPREDAFHHGMVVHFGCNEGFTRVGPESAQCYQFGWSPQLPICKENVTSCPVSPIISHGKITGEPKPIYQHGDLLEVQCDISFALYGSKIIECVDGEWAPLPSCTEESKTCRRPPPIKNGQLVNTKSPPYRHGDTVTYECKKHSVLNGTNPAKCLHGRWDVPSCLVNPRDCTRPQYADFQPTVLTTKRFHTNQFANYRCGSNLHQTNCVNGLWFPEPRCKGTCPPPPQLPNAINVAEMRIYRSEEEISFKCQEHFLLHGPQKIKCDDGKWQTPPRCLDLRCKPPPEIENGITLIENGAMFPPGEIVEYRCSLGFEISQLNTVKCENGKWSELPVCREKSCGPAPDIPNASLRQENREQYDSGTIINYTCNPGFEAKESAKKTCRRGEWVGAFTCKDIRCSSPPEIEHARITGVRKAKYLTGDKMKYQCNPGYVLLGNSFITCLKEGWTEIPRCTDIEGKCGRPPPVENGDVVNTPKLFYLQSESVTYQCQNFYTMEGSPRVTCQNGRWSQTPTCRVACTASEEDMTQRNIRLKWPNGDTLYSMDGGVVEFICLRGYKPHPTSGPFRIYCVEGKFDYPNCIQSN